MARRRRRPAILAAAALGVAVASAAGPGRRLDEIGFRHLNAARGAFADRLFGGITELGSIFGSAGSAGALALAGKRTTAGRALGAAAAMWVTGQILKRVVRRPRPYDALPDTTRLLIGRPRGTSWPSSHPAVLLAFLTVVDRDLNLGSPVRAALAALTGAVGTSRVYLGVHYPSDVIGGVLLGRAIGIAWGGGNQGPSVE